MRKKIFEHLRSNSHKYAEKTIENAEENILPYTFLATNEKRFATTERVFR